MNEDMKKAFDKMNEISSINLMDDDYEQKSKECACAAIDYLMGLVGIKEGVNSSTGMEIANAGAFIDHISRMAFYALINLTYAYDHNNITTTVLKLTKTIKSYERAIFDVIGAIDKVYEDLKSKE